MNKWHAQPWAVLLTLSLGFFMTLLDLTIVNIAIPSMINALGASLDEVLWVINAYTVVLAVLLITAGRIGDLYGQRNVFIAGVALFTLASLACGLSQSPGQLIAARAVQGVGAATLMPQTMAMIISTFPPQRRGTALGVWGAVAGLSTVAGPTLGGLLITTADWRWIFFINVPVGAVVLVASVLFLPGTRLGRQHRFDITGVVIATAALLCVTFALTEGQRYSWSGWIWGLLAAGVLLAVVFVVQQRSRQEREPLLPFVLFRDRSFSALSVVGAAVSVGVIGFFIPMTIYLQSVLGYSALKAGLVLAPSSLVSMLVAPIAGRLSDRVGGKFILVSGLLLFAAGAAWTALVAQADTAWPALIAPLIVAGLGMGATFAPMATEVMRGVPPRLAGAASGVNNTFRQVGSAIGSAAVGAVLQNRLAVALPEEAARRSAALPAGVRSAFVAGFRNASGAGLEVGGAGAGAHPPAGVPPQLAQQLQRLGEQVFHSGFVTAMRPTLVLPITVIVLGAVACLGARRHGAEQPVMGVPPAAELAPEPGAAGG